MKHLHYCASELVKCFHLVYLIPQNPLTCQVFCISILLTKIIWAQRSQATLREVGHRGATRNSQGWT